MLPPSPTPRRWPRRTLIAGGVVLSLFVLLAGLAYGYVRYRLDSIRTEAAPHLSAEVHGGPDSRGGLAPENILLIGNETRSGITNPTEIQEFGSPTELSGSLSDVIMILHLDPKKYTASLLSIPRDLFLPMPPDSGLGPYEKVDAALNDGSNGPDNLIQTLTDDLGIPINHFVELDFDGFQATVNAIGGIKIDFPEPVFDAQSGLNITTPGCAHLGGAQALALVRARHLQYDPPGNTESHAYWPYDPESDLSRIVRDHTFLRVVATTAESQGLTDPIKANAFLGAVINQVTIDPGLKGQLISLASHYRHINPANVPETTLPITTVGSAYGYTYAGSAIGDVDFAVEPADEQVIQAWDPQALPAPTLPTAVNIVNIAGVAHLASNTSASLRTDGFTIGTATTGSEPAGTTETLIRYAPGNLAQAVSVLDELSGAVMLQQEPGQAPGTVELDVGSTFAVLPPPSAAPATTASTVAGQATTTTTINVPTPGGEAPSSATDVVRPWDPIPCPPAAS